MVLDKYGNDIGSYCADSFLARHSQLSSIFIVLIDEASLSKEYFEYLVARHSELQENSRQIKSKSPLGGSMHNEIDNDQQCD